MENLAYAERSGELAPSQCEPGGLVPAAELVELCALDSELYCRTFFPGTFRQKTPPFHLDIWEMLESRAHRHVAAKVFRGGAKTTLTRAYTSKRIAYGISRTILYISASQDHAKASLQWLRKQVQYNQLWASIFGLSPGQKWTDEYIEVRHRALGFPITVVARGITGQTRGLNIDDYRPDLIVVDDPCDEENTATPEQRLKISDLFFGALEKSLAPPTEAPDAKIVLLQTPFNDQDLISTCSKSPDWRCSTYSCFDERGESIWPNRFPTAFLNEEKGKHVRQGKILLWLREMQCLCANEETAEFRREWLQFYDVLPPGMAIYMGIDPVPPPSERQEKTGLQDKDYEVLSVVGVHEMGYYLLEYSMSRGHTPEWTLAEFFRLLDKWRPIRVRLEGIAYQRTLKYLLEKEMSARRRYVQINAVADKRKKRHRISQAMSGPASQRRLFVHNSMISFVEQFAAYPNMEHDDLLDSVAMAMDEASDHGLGYLEELEAHGAQTAQKELSKRWQAAP